MKYFAGPFLFAALLCCFINMPLIGQGQQKVVPVIKDLLQPLEQPVMTGFIGERLDAAYSNRLLVQDVDRLVSPFRLRTESSCWQTEFWGKWLTSAILAYHYKPTTQLKTLLDKAVADLIATQATDGYIGNYAPNKHLQQWDIWGRKYCMLGLIAYYDLTKDNKSLNAATRIAGHLLKEIKESAVPIVKMGNHRGMAACSVLEPIVLLYSRTGDKTYLDFAEEIVREWETPDGPQLISKSITPVGKRFPKPLHSWYGWEQGQKAYEMMSCYEGLLELYRVTGNENYKAAVENTWESIKNTEINIGGSGSAAECWFGGKDYQTLAINHYQETCVTATWIKLSQQLLRLTGKAKYADAIEQTYCNSLLGSMYNDGTDWAKYSPLSGQRLKGEQQCGMGINCCEASGPRGLFTWPLTVVMKSAAGVAINFFTAGSYSTKTPGNQALVIEQTTSYPATGKIILAVNLAKEENFSMQIRNPQWSQQSSVTVNGVPVPVGMPGNFITVERKWKDGDRIVVDLDMRGRLLVSGGRGEYFAIVRGPVVLARDMRLGMPDAGEPLTPVLTKEGFVDLQPAEASNNNYWMVLKASFMAESHAESGSGPVQVTLCDYASAGKTYDAISRFRVWIPLLVHAEKLP